MQSIKTKVLSAQIKPVRLPVWVHRGHDVDMWQISELTMTGLEGLVTNSKTYMPFILNICSILPKLRTNTT